jgi:hypothetical protein
MDQKEVEEKLAEFDKKIIEEQLTGDTKPLIKRLLCFVEDIDEMANLDPLWALVMAHSFLAFFEEDEKWNIEFALATIDKKIEMLYSRCDSKYFADPEEIMKRMHGLSSVLEYNAHKLKDQRYSVTCYKMLFCLTGEKEHLRMSELSLFSYPQSGEFKESDHTGMFG